MVRLDRFYAGIIRSYIYVNKIFYEQNKNLALPENLWGQPKSPSINIKFCDIGLFTVVDLPLKNNKTIDYVMVQNKFHQNKISFSSFLTCYHLQCVFGSTLSAIMEGSHLVHEELILGAKVLLLNTTTDMLLLTKWETFFQKMLKSNVGKQKGKKKQMLESCKYTKFQELNFKILSRILLTPKIMAAVKSEPDLSACPWCKGLGTLEHMLIICKTVSSAQKSLVLRNKNLMPSWKEHYWIFGTK